MIGLIQRVSSAKVDVSNNTISHIEQGILLLLGIEKEDNQEKADKLLQRVLNYRIFEDDTGRMNLSLNNIKGDLLVVSQFTLAADTKKGLRPSFSSAASPEIAKTLYDYFLIQAKQTDLLIQSGEFGADMQVSLVNDGPVTFWLQV